MVYGDRLQRDQYYASAIRVYGKNGTMGPLEPVKEIRSHELCLVFEVTAPTQEIATLDRGDHPPPGAAPADPGVERPHHRGRAALQRARPRRRLSLQREPRRRARRSVRDVPDGNGRQSAAPQRRSVSMTTLADARPPDPQQERRPVRADVRHHVRRRGDLSPRASDSGAVTRERIAAIYGLRVRGRAVLLLRQRAGDEGVDSAAHHAGRRLRHATAMAASSTRR